VEGELKDGREGGEEKDAVVTRSSAIPRAEMRNSATPPSPLCGRRGTSGLSHPSCFPVSTTAV
jgi:hypothetical protein